MNCCFEWRVVCLALEVVVVVVVVFLRTSVMTEQFAVFFVELTSQLNLIVVQLIKQQQQQL